MSAATACYWKLYGVPLSQPFRSVAWALLQNHVRFDVQLIVPGATTVKIGSLTESYQSKSRMRTTRIPLLEDTRTGFTVAESPAILSFLCEYYGWNALYGPPGSAKKATIDSYMHWHHTGTRTLARLAFPYFRPESNLPVNTDKDRARTFQMLETLETGWFSSLNHDNDDDWFLAGGTSPSIADLLAYEEVVQLPMLGLIPDDILQQKYPKIGAWTHRMRQLPYHNEVHVALATLGDVTKTIDDDQPVSKRLGAATKAGLQALAQVQKDFGDDESSVAHPPPVSEL